PVSRSDRVDLPRYADAARRARDRPRCVRSSRSLAAKRGSTLRRAMEGLPAAGQGSGPPTGRTGGHASTPEHTRTCYARQDHHVRWSTKLRSPLSRTTIKPAAERRKTTARRTSEATSLEPSTANIPAYQRSRGRTPARILGRRPRSPPGSSTGQRRSQGPGATNAALPAPPVVMSAARPRAVHQPGDATVWELSRAATHRIHGDRQHPPPTSG